MTRLYNSLSWRISDSSNAEAIVPTAIMTPVSRCCCDQFGLEDRFYSLRDGIICMDMRLMMTRAYHFAQTQCFNIHADK